MEVIKKQRKQEGRRINMTGKRNKKMEDSKNCLIRKYH
jgi:hypothetical protein